MRIQSKPFLLTLRLGHRDPANRMTLEAYGSNFDKLTIRSAVNGAVETVDILTCMPNRVMLILSGNGSIKLLSMKLAGLPISQALLPNLAEYKSIGPMETKNSPQEYLANAGEKTTLGNHPGCVLFDLFDPNPFAYHMYIGNKIQF